MVSSSRVDGLLNEYKGNLYEFLVAQHISRKLNLESSFLKSIPPEFLKLLGVYESFIRENFPYLIGNLNDLALSLSENIIIDLKIETLKNIQLIGKIALAGHDDRYAEADIILENDDHLWPISIKLCHESGQLNCKSAGVKSFLSKYFNFDSSSMIQDKFSRIFDDKFTEFSYQLHELNDVEYDNSFSNWKESGLASLPGQLEGNSKELYRTFIAHITKELYVSISNIVRDNSINISNLLGLSDSRLINAITLYKKDKSLDYVLYKNIVKKFQRIKSIKLDEGNFYIKGSAIYIKTDLGLLQIRVKAMNKFTSKSFKVNCSLKLSH